MTELSLWLIPDNEWHHLLSRIIARLSQQYNTPRFEPHLTLLSGIAIDHQNAIHHAAQLATQLGLGAFEIVMKRLSHRDEFFRALFLEAVRTPRLMDAHQMASTLFDQEPNRAFLPHISLMYGNLPATVKEEIIDQLASELKLPLSFRVSRVDLVVASSRLPPSSWYRIASYMLGEEAAQSSRFTEDVFK
ncbi:MAG: 2'-5' RNA ligase family protein [Anaerolineae bacterium]